jgi:hypothetical protein
MTGRLMLLGKNLDMIPATTPKASMKSKAVTSGPVTASALSRDVEKSIIPFTSCYLSADKQLLHQSYKTGLHCALLLLTPTLEFKRSQIYSLKILIAYISPLKSIK